MKFPLILVFTGLLQLSCAEEPAPVHSFRGICDASAAVPLGENAFVVADDETNLLRVYRLDTGSPDVVKTFDLGEPLGVADMKNPETDIEGATRVGNTIYWITSHGRSKKGKWRDARYFFFATTITDPQSPEPMAMIGKPYKRMIHTLVRLPGLNLRRFVGELGEDEGKNFAPKESGINIESLCASPDGETLYLGFRNPQPGERAILLPLENPVEVIAGTGIAPRFGAPRLLDMDGLGFRAMEYSPFHKCYLIVAGPHDSGGDSKLFKWSGEAKDKPELVQVLSGYNPEAIMVYPEKAEVLLLSDDGTVLMDAKPGESSEAVVAGKCECKTLIDPLKKSFRVFRVTVPFLKD